MARREVELTFVNQCELRFTSSGFCNPQTTFYVNHNLQGRDLRDWRTAHHLGQEELADLLGIARVWLSKIENGHKLISDTLFLRFEALKRNPKFTGATTSESVMEEQKPYLAGDAPASRPRIEQWIKGYLDLAEQTPGGLGYAWGQVRLHLRPADMEHLAATSQRPENETIEEQLDRLKRRAAEIRGEPLPETQPYAPRKRTA